MKVLWVSHLIPFPPQGGARQRSFGLLRGLARQHDITFVGFNQSDFCSQAELDEACSGLGHYCRVAHVQTVPTETRFQGKKRLALRSLFTHHPYTVNWLKSPVFAEKIASIARDVRPDLLHFDTISLAPYRRLLPRVLATLNHHNIESHMLFRRAEKAENFLARQYYRQEARRLTRYEREVTSEFDLHLVCSAPDAERLCSISRHARVAVVPNGVDTGYYHPANPSPERIPKSLIFVGGLSWYPNVSAVKFLLHRIWPLIPDEDASLTIVGRSPPDWLTAIARHDQRVKVTGWVDDVRPLMARSAVSVCPIFDGGGTKLKVLDALAMGVPLVAHPIACEGIEVQAGRHVLMAGTEEEFARQIRTLWNNPSLGADLASEGVALIEGKYSFDAIGKGLSDLYTKLGQSSGAATDHSPIPGPG